jgi:hypothetical protein
VNKARKKHEEGKAQLDAYFENANPALWSMKNDIQTGRPTRFRRKPGVPPIQTPEYKKRRKLRKIAKASRKRNA